MPAIIELKDQLELVPTKNYPYATWPFENFNPVQSRIFEYYKEDMNMIVATATSSGKAQPLDALILTPHGYCKNSMLKIGDEVIGANGKASKIVGIFPQGIKEVFEVSFDDGTKTECCIDHLWTTRTRSQKKRNDNKWETIPLKDIIENFKHGKYHIPYTEKVEFSEKDLPIDPYLLGMIIGDGGIGYSCNITLTEEKIIDKLSELLPKNHELKYSNRYDYRIVGTEGNQYNEIRFYLSKLGLWGKRSYEKHIPDIYLYGSIRQRIQLLQGLMDSDGGYDTHGYPSFEVTSKELAENMAFLVRSLGGRTKIREKTRSTFKYKGQVKEGRKVYRMTISLISDVFAYSVKGDKTLKNFSRQKNKNIENIKKIGSKECQCIKIENEDGLYLTNDFIVTHNTVCSEMLMADDIRRNKGKCMFLVPLRALAQEKIDDWTDKNYHFKDLKISICTGDYKITKERQKELDEADIIIMSTEMFAHKTRCYQSEKNDFLKNITTLIIDEVHLLGVPGRGTALEVGLMKFAKINPKARIIGLSATIPNVNEMAEWFSDALNHKQTYVLKSQYRPCKLNVHYETYEDYTRNYDVLENLKVNAALSIIEDYPEDKFLVFAHTKKIGELMKTSLKKLGIHSEFHNANLDKKDRIKIQDDFINDKNLRVIIATSGMAWGINVPARRVIILGVHRGLEEVATYDIGQMIGRAGRPAYDPAGDAYILVPDSKKDIYKNKYSKQDNIRSQLLENNQTGKYKNLAFHIVSEIYHGDINTKEGIYSWYQKSLANFQDHDMKEDVLEITIDSLKKCGAIMEDDGNYTANSTGMISSIFYYSPYDVADLRKNFNELFNGGNCKDDLEVAMALASTDTFKEGIISKAEKEEMATFAGLVMKRYGAKKYFDQIIKIGFCYHNLMNGNNSFSCANTMRNLQADFPRVMQVVQTIDSMSAKWNKKEFLSQIEQRIQYGVKPELLDLVKIPDIGKARAKKLYESGIKTVKDFVGTDINNLKKIVNLKIEKIVTIVDEAKKLA